jgi:hypothetical protein
MANVGPTQPRPGAAQFSRRAVASLLGRYQGPELFFQQPFTALTSPIIPRNINLTRPLDSIDIVWRGRIVQAVAPLVTIAAEAPQTIIQRIRLTGTHRLYNQLVPIDMTGATCFAWSRLFQEHGNVLIINAAKQPELTTPNQQIAATFGAVATYDVEIHYHVPLTPMYPPASRISTIPFCYLPSDWADSLQLQLFFGDATSFGTAAGTTTFSAFGSGAGSPTVSIFCNYLILGPLANSIQAAVVIRSEQTTQSNVTAIGNGMRLSLLQKQKTMNIVVKSGTLLGATSAGVQVFQTLSDVMLDRSQIILDNKPVRNNQANFAAKQFQARQFNTGPVGGYLDFSFIDSMNPLTYYRGDQVPGGSTFELDSDVLTAGATQAISIVQEQVFGTPRGKM